jgi:hypothetical protein
MGLELTINLMKWLNPENNLWSKNLCEYSCPGQCLTFNEARNAWQGNGKRKILSFNGRNGSRKNSVPALQVHQSFKLAVGWCEVAFHLELILVDASWVNIRKLLR